MPEWIVPLLAGVSGWLGGLIVIRLAPLINLVDQPNERSSHVTPTPRGGGLGFVVGGTLCGFYLAQESDSLQMALLWGGGLAVSGLVDDVRSLPRWFRFVLQLVTVLGLLWAMGFLSQGMLFRDYGAIIVLVFTGVWWVNLFNFMDGIDGIAAVEALCILIVALGFLLELHPESVGSAEWWLMIALAAAVGGFLVLNWPPARVFMGDSGSTWLAYILLVIALFSELSDWLSFFTWAILGAVFIVDSSVTLSRRIYRGERWYEAHRSHVYQLVAAKLEGSIAAAGARSGAGCRAAAHRRVLQVVVAVNLLWLAPLAYVAQTMPEVVEWVVFLAYFPLITVACLYEGREASQ